MKKRIVAIFLTLLIIASGTLFALAEGGVELPMIPAGGGTTPSAVVVKMVSDAEGTASRGEDVEFTTGISEIKSKGLSKAIYEYSYTRGLSFNSDIKVIGLPDGWSIKNINDQNNTLSFEVSADSLDDAITSRNLDLTFSFEVTALSGKQLLVTLSSISLYDKSGNSITTVSKKIENNVFSSIASLPEITNVGAALRINNTPALRFGMIVAKDSAFTRAFPRGEYVYSKSNNMQFGMLVIESSKLRGELTEETSGAEKIMFSTALSSNNNETLFVHTVDGVSDYTKEYTFRPFVMYRETAESEFEYQYGEAKSRSARTVAEMELLSETSNKKIEMLKKFTK